MKTELKIIVRKYLKQINKEYKEIEEDFIIYYNDKGHNEDELRRIIKKYLNNKSYEQIKQDFLRYHEDEEFSPDDFYKYICNEAEQEDKTYKQIKNNNSKQHFIINYKIFCDIVKNYIPDPVLDYIYNPEENLKKYVLETFNKNIDYYYKNKYFDD